VDWQSVKRALEEEFENLDADSLDIIKGKLDNDGNNCIGVAYIYIYIYIYI